MGTRILHFPRNIGGHPKGLAQAESQYGVSALAVDLESSPFEVGASMGAAQRCVLLIKDLFWLSYALLFADAVHFNYGQKFFPFGVQASKPGEALVKRLSRYLGHYLSDALGEMDLWLLKLFKVRVVVTFQGDDIRIGAFCAQNYSIHFVNEVDSSYYDAVSDERKRKQISIWRKYADQIYALNPDLLNQLPLGAKFLPYAHVNLADWRSVKSNSPKPLIVHAPTNRAVKGTKYIEAAVRSLRRRGFEFDFVLVEGLPLAEARQIYAKASIVVDQLLAGWYGGFAVEAMALGKPVISYIRESDLKHVPPEMAADLPIYSATPETIENVLAEFLENRIDLSRASGRSRFFVEKWHDPIEVAKITIGAYMGEK